MEKQTQIEQEFGEYLESQKALIIKLAHAYCYEEEERKDLIQDILVQLWKAFPSYRPEYARSTWTYRIALNVSISWLRKRKRSFQKKQNLKDEMEFLLWDNSILDQRLNKLYQAIENLKPMEKAQIILHLEGLAHKEIAEILGISVSNISTKLQRIKRKLQKQLTNKI
ncbi:MAG: sigma-70 family RNA polymerase sigma factor [Bacteroidia bacterium]|nr:sigma-70 family RNA polymerase sigma factor [Bacteroidia bacterium]